VTVTDTTLYLFDGYNLFHAGGFSDRRELVDLLASFVAGSGGRGVLVFDGVGEDREVGPLEVRYAAHADDVLERLAAEHRTSELVCVVSSDAAVVRTSGQDVRKLSSRQFLAELAPPVHTETEQQGAGGRIRDNLDPETREKLERLRRGE
jgi:predicted RNA-binding protein with PIN domain